MSSEVLQTELEELISRVRLGDNSAFEQLVGLYEPLIKSMSSRYADKAGVHGESLVEDFSQESRLALYRAAVKYRFGGGVSFGLYAKICIRNALVSVLRRMSRKKDRVPQGAELTDKPYSDLRAARSVISDGGIDELLSDYESRVLEMYIAGDKVRFIASALGKSPKSVSNAICRIKQKARQK